VKKFLLVFFISFLITFDLSALTPNSSIVGIWSLARIKAPNTKKFDTPVYKMTYHFFDDGNLVINNLSFRERTFWTWGISKKGILRIQSKSSKSRFVGKVYFKSKNIFIYSLFFKDKKKYIWIFQRM